MSEVTLQADTAEEMRQAVVSHLKAWAEDARKRVLVVKTARDRISWNAEASAIEDAARFFRDLRIEAKGEPK